MDFSISIPWLQLDGGDCNGLINQTSIMQKYQTEIKSKDQNFEDGFAIKRRATQHDFKMRNRRNGKHRKIEVFLMSECCPCGL